MSTQISKLLSLHRSDNLPLLLISECQHQPKPTGWWDIRDLNTGIGCAVEPGTGTDKIGLLNCLSMGKNEPNHVTNAAQYYMQDTSPDMRFPILESEPHYRSGKP